MNLNETLKNLPPVDRVLSSPLAAPLLEEYGRERVRGAVRRVLDGARKAVIEGAADEPPLHGEQDVIDAAALSLARESAPRLRKVLNLSGVIVHTNLGRSALAQEAARAAHMAAMGAVNVEYDIESGERGDRDDLVAGLITGITGAEAATVVNNNAAAVMLALNTLAERREVMVSRGELIEIGGSFRLPEIMTKSGCLLREVGTTNRTHMSDYEGAVSDNTALILRAHTSNYRIIGFTSHPPLPELSSFARSINAPLMVDLGSGTLVDLSAFGLPHEPTVQETLRDGADVVTFSGDKLLGGPQSGIIAGKSEIIRRIKKNHLKRALRLDKMSLAALEATLRLYLNPEKAPERIPTLRRLARSIDEIRAIAGEAAGIAAGRLGSEAEVFVMDDVCRAGAGSLPEVDIPSVSVAIRHKSLGPGELAARFRRLDPPVIGRVENELFRLDARCIEDTGELSAALLSWEKL